MSQAEQLEEMIVAEISLNYTSEAPEWKAPISRLFERLIAYNRARGYALESWQFSQVMTADFVLTETIIAVFQRWHPDAWISR
jgi:hypothetical protein